MHKDGFLGLPFAPSKKPLCYSVRATINLIGGFYEKSIINQRASIL